MKVGNKIDESNVLTENLAPRKTKPTKKRTQVSIVMVRLTSHPKAALSTMPTPDTPPDTIE